MVVSGEARIQTQDWIQNPCSFSLNVGASQKHLHVRNGCYITSV